MRAVLALEDGTCYEGIAIGAVGETGGEVVFNTSMAGYQEILTDPSYAGQIVTMTAVEIGNYGVNREDVESSKPQVAGFIVRDASPLASNWRSTSTLQEYLAAHSIVAVAGIDTRALTRKLRSGGVMRGVIRTEDPASGTSLSTSDLVDRARAVPPMEGSDLVRVVTCETPWTFVPGDRLSASAPGATADKSDSRTVGRSDLPDPLVLPAERRASAPFRVAAYDFGVKLNLLRRLAAYGCDVCVYPATTPARTLLETKPDGVFLSNGPGDPAPLDYAIDNVRAMLDAGTPLFGVCLGHQLLSLACGARTYKLKFGHRGANHPVNRLATGRVEITSQNHGFAVDPAGLPDSLEVTHLNLYDGTVEGVRHRTRAAFSVQYHPEASPGPHDADYLFSAFLDEMERRRNA